ncbi:MAG: cytochrome-c peroxidase [Saprospiraceae bacterium]
MKTNQLLLLLFCFSLTFTACLEDKTEILYRFYSDEDYQVLSQTLDLPNEVVNYNSETDRQFVFTPPVSNNTALLGRVLFYDHKLSKNEKVSCASCHLQDHGFADKVAFSEGFDGRLTERNSLSLSINISTYESQGIGFFWDERSNSVREQSIETIENPIEMGMKMDELADRLKQEEYYQILFAKAFPSQGINKSTITSALSSFVNSIATFDSKFDREFRQKGTMHEDFDGFTVDENRGRALFVANCQSCHGNMMFPSRNMANNGLDMEYSDQGLGARTQNAHDNGVFKIPSLRNVAISGPYMHDGRFNSLMEVMEHYSEGIQEHPNLDFELRDENAHARKMNFTSTEKADLVAFLETLTDKTLIEDKRFSDPFIR